MKKIHIHMSSIQYTVGGEKKHMDFKDAEFGPDYRLLMQAILARDAEPVIICESHSDRTGDSILMKDYYYGLKEGRAI
jgi:endonuclease IV